MMRDRISLTVSDGVADVRLDRPGKMNAIDSAMFAALDEAGRHLATLPGLRAVVLSGVGKGFCAGLDMANFADMAGDGSSLADTLHVRTHGVANLAQHVCTLWRNLPVPVIAAVHGLAFGGGLQIMLGADVRIVTPDVRLSIMEIKWGLVPDMAGFVLTRGLIREDHLRELTFTGRQVNGEEAVRLGLATQVSATPLEDALAMARQIASSNPDAIRAAKRLFNLAPKADDGAILLLESLEQQKLISSPNQVEAVKANMEKRAPAFRDE